MGLIKYIKVKAVQDESCHWYIIPIELSETFKILHEKACNEDYEAEDKFCEIFNKYRTGGDLNNIQLYKLEE